MPRNPLNPRGPYRKPRKRYGGDVGDIMSWAGKRFREDETEAFAVGAFLLGRIMGVGSVIVAGHLGVSERTVRRRIAEGRKRLARAIEGGDVTRDDLHDLEIRIGGARVGA